MDMVEMMDAIFGVGLSLCVKVSSTIKIMCTLRVSGFCPLQLIFIWLK